MFKYLLVIGSFMSVSNSVQAQNATAYYKVHPLEISDAHAQFAGSDVDFGFNFTESIDEKFIHTGYYLWIQDQWYFIKNAQKIFKSEPETPLLFQVANPSEKLKIEDVLGVEYTYPIEAIETYTISAKDFNHWKTQPQSLTHTVITLNNATQPTTSENPAVLETTLKEAQKIENPADVESSPILDVLDIVETKVETIIPFDPEKSSKADTKEGEENLSEVEKRTPKDEIAETKELPKAPQNAYEKAVAEGFDGTVTEWVDFVNAKGGKTAFQQAQEGGFQGTEEEWMRSLWGTNVAPEIAQQEKTTSIVVQWMKELNSNEGYSPYEVALRNGFYGTFTEWVESVVGTDGEEAYQAEVAKGYTKTYKEWIEEKLNASNAEVLRKDQLRKNNFVVVPNVAIDVPMYTDEVATFDLYQYYQEYYGNSVISSSGKSAKIELRRSDLEYQVTWFNSKDIEVIELSSEGILTFSCGVSGVNTTTINVRFILKN